MSTKKKKNNGLPYGAECRTCAGMQGACGKRSLKDLIKHPGSQAGKLEKNPRTQSTMSS